MGKNIPIMAIVYDFDGTLSPRDMQEYDFIPKLGMSSKKFWKEVQEKAQEYNSDRILTYMHCMVKKAQEKNVSVQKKKFREFGKEVELFKGVKSWFNRINQYAKKHDLRVEHYIVSSGILEMIMASPIRRWFKKIFASTFIYDSNDVACWPAIAVNYTTKTQFLFRINKGSLDISDDSKINRYVPQEERPIPFERMIYIGDGSTDVPCMKLVKEQGGHSIAVYSPHKSRKKAHSLINQGRVNFVLPADYSKNKSLDKVVKSIIDKISATARVQILEKKRYVNKARGPRNNKNEQK